MRQTPIATFYPVFVLRIALLQQLPLQIFFTFWAGLFFGGMFQTILRPVLSAASLMISPFVAIGVLVFFGFPVVVVASRAMNYRNTQYRLFAERLEIEEGFMTLHEKRIMFRDVREVSIRRGILQRTAGLGSVYLATQATGTDASWSAFRLLGSGSTFGSGAMIMDIPDAGEAYERLRDLVDRTQHD